MTPTELKQLRFDMGLSRKAMADKLYISPSALDKLESGKNKMSRPVEALARLLPESKT